MASAMKRTTLALPSEPGHAALVRGLLRGAADVRSLLAAVAPAVAVVSAYALLLPLRLDPIAWENVSCVAGVPRAAGTLAHANLLGAYLAMTTPLLAALSLHAFRRGAT